MASLCFILILRFQAETVNYLDSRYCMLLIKIGVSRALTWCSRGLNRAVISHRRGISVWKLYRKNNFIYIPVSFCFREAKFVLLLTATDRQTDTLDCSLYIFSILHELFAPPHPFLHPNNRKQALISGAPHEFLFHSTKERDCAHEAFSDLTGDVTSTTFRKCRYSWARFRRTEES